MATPRPPIDPFNPIIQALVDELEKQLFPGGGLEDHAPQAVQDYNEDFKRPYVCDLMANVLTGRWKMGTTQEEIADHLGLSDRTWVSRALNHGKMTMEIYMRLRCWPLRPEDWEPNVKAITGDMRRSGFIGAARGLAMLIKTRPTLVPQRLEELNYELICEMFATLTTWLPAYVRGEVRVAADLVNNVCLDDRRSVCPFWCTQSKRNEVKTEINRLIRNPVAAYEHLEQLQRDWLDVFAATDAILEQERKKS